MNHEVLNPKERPTLTANEYNDLALMDTDHPTEAQSELLRRIGTIVDGPNVPILVVDSDGSMVEKLFCASKQDFGTNIVLNDSEAIDRNSASLPPEYEMTSNEPQILSMKSRVICASS